MSTPSPTKRVRVSDSSPDCSSRLWSEGEARVRDAEAAIALAEKGLRTAERRRDRAQDDVRVAETVLREATRRLTSDMLIEDDEGKLPLVMPVDGGVAVGINVVSVRGENVVSVYWQCPSEDDVSGREFASYVNTVERETYLDAMSRVTVPQALRDVVPIETLWGLIRKYGAGPVKQYMDGDISSFQEFTINDVFDRAEGVSVEAQPDGTFHATASITSEENILFVIPRSELGAFFGLPSMQWSRVMDTNPELTRPDDDLPIHVDGSHYAS